jgi:hypothetical protein
MSKPPKKKQKVGKKKTAQAHRFASFFSSSSSSISDPCTDENKDDEEKISEIQPEASVSRTSSSSALPKSKFLDEWITKDIVGKRDWLETNETRDKMFCKLCRKYRNMVRIHHNQKRWITSEGCVRMRWGL